METYKETLHNLKWEELINLASEILTRDTKALEANINYYKKIINENSGDKEKINRLFEKLQLDKLRYSCFSELFFRLDDSKYKFMIMQLESCIQQETSLQDRSPKDWVATVRFEDGNIKVYFMALSYYQ